MTEQNVLWGEITGDLANQSDLKLLLDSKAGKDAVYLSNNNLNTVLSEGYYYAEGNNTCTNKPSGIAAFGMRVSRTARGYYCQILIGANEKTNIMFVRSCTSAAGTGWTDWIQYAATSDLESKVNISDLSAVATSGLYDDLTGKPVIPDVPENITGDMSGSINLEYNKNRQGEAVGDISFILPNGNADSGMKEIKVDLYIPDTSYSIDLGTGKYFHNTVPDFSKPGAYSLTYQYDVNLSDWAVGVLYKGIKDVTLTINPTPSDAEVIFSAEGFTQSGNSITVTAGTSVFYNVYKNGYTAQNDTIVVNDYMTMDITLVPSPYTEIIAVRNSNFVRNTFIDTGIILDSYDWEIEIKYRINEFYTREHQYLMWASPGDNMCFKRVTWSSPRDDIWMYRNAIYLTSSTEMAQQNIIYTDIYSNKKLIRNGKQYTPTTIGNPQLYKQKVLLFCDNNKTSQYSIKADIFYVKFRKAGELVAEFVPHIRNSDDKVGLLDTISNNFVTLNKGELDYVTTID